VSLFIKREMIQQLIELGERYSDEAAICAEAGASQATAVMLAIAFEARLFCAVAMSQHVLEPEGKWPSGNPSKWELGRLVGVAREAGWFGSDPILEEAVSAINDLRITAVHPAAYVRDGAWFVTERELEAMRKVLIGAMDVLARIVRELPPPSAEALA
jgi:hypothetical protein